MAGDAERVREHFRDDDPTDEDEDEEPIARQRDASWPDDGAPEDGDDDGCEDGHRDEVLQEQQAAP